MVHIDIFNLKICKRKKWATCTRKQLTKKSARWGYVSPVFSDYM